MKTRLFFIMLLFPLLGICQEAPDKRFVHEGILCGDISIAPGMLLNQNISTISIPATLEYYWDDHVSLKNDIYFHVSSGLTNDSLRLIANHQLFVGIAYHFTTKGNFDPYVGFQPGIAYSQVKNESKIPFSDQTPYGRIEYSPSLNPVLGLSVGFNYYFFRYFHLFVEARYVHGTHLYNAPGAFPLDELKCQFGLGWNLNLIRKKKI
jgi:hypothetical protein